MGWWGERYLVDDGATHACDDDDASCDVLRVKVPRSSLGAEECSVDVYIYNPPEVFGRVVDGRNFLGNACTADEAF